RQLMAHGAAPDLADAVVQDGSIASQKVVTGTLSNIPERVTRGPALTLLTHHWRCRQAARQPGVVQA
ncbi:MAG: siroheme synthase, partial [Rhodoferax sp.]|nr:siroheme synthase [Rhodoferax sp.]